MMFGERLEIVLTVKALSDLRIGSGHVEADQALRSDDDAAAPEYALAVRDADGRPIIPATSLKGALRAQSGLAGAQADGLWGRAGETDSRIARLWLGTLVGTPAPGGGLSGLTKVVSHDGSGYVKTGVRIDRASGAAMDKRLYNREWIARDAIFEGKAILFLDSADEDEAELIERVGRALAPLAGDDGMALGSGRRHGAGRVRLDGLRVTRRRIDSASLDLRDTDEPALAAKILKSASDHAAAKAGETVELRLTCTGPFISIRAKEKPAGSDREITQPLEHDNRPVLWPSSLLGALRARAAWLAEIARLRDDHRFGQKPPDEPLDDPDRVVRRIGEIADLSSIERVFGIAGWRGLLQVRDLIPREDGGGGPQEITNVTIDRFTGGAMNQRLFTERTHLFPAFTATLGWDDRRADHRTMADEALLEALLNDLDDNGLELGHGAAKGYGWFDVEVAA